MNPGSVQTTLIENIPKDIVEKQKEYTDREEVKYSR
jgi:hypothetical protein